MDERTMKLSEAIRKGSELRPMTVGGYFTWHNGISSDALGAAYEGIGNIVQPCGLSGGLDVVGATNALWAVLDDWLWTGHQDVGDFSLRHIINAMSMSNRFTREEIADWLESVGQ